MNHEEVTFAFHMAQMGVGTLLVAGLLWTRRQRPSAFKLREADRLKEHVFPRFPSLVVEPDRPRPQPRQRKAEPLKLGGISIAGEAHEILGVKTDASKADIQRAWRELMKRYHPDKVGRPGSREWNDAQRIAEAVNRAKEEMISRRRGA
jgi:DnaJ-domain-containing protein 1